MMMENVEQSGDKSRPDNDDTLEKSSMARSGSFAANNAINRPLKSDKVQLLASFSIMLRISLVSLKGIALIFSRKFTARIPAVPSSRCKADDATTLGVLEGAKTMART
ncbi:hypothetical protein F3Y22_tig00000778pilonHSYRG00039 [Hibiscus syriacus]|uniref:Uncharacterized protein n=1 Tax=Hibiscus syriacus TaxID=106335 RepID=A0A6A3CWS1_HIBSY|nr:hypothetical protein F3Y22_tig00000778pilonHSYRG00039 [Hibiscus syriacus]